MNITKNQIDALNLEFSVKIQSSDYLEKVEQKLKNYRKTAKVDGFRPGFAPMSLIKKQYGEVIRFDEINNLLQKSINDFITAEKLNIIGQPLPKEKTDLDWNADELDFVFEIGLAPEIKVDLAQIKVPYYKIVATEEQIDKYIENFRLNFGEKKPIDTVEENTELSVQIKSSGDESFDEIIRLSITELKNAKEIIGKNKNETIIANASDFFETEEKFAEISNKSLEDIKEIFTHEINFTIQEITKREPAVLGQELFSKIYPNEAISTEDEFKLKIKQEAEDTYKNDSDRQFLNDVVEELIENTSISLPDAFLERWIRFSGEKQISEEEAKMEYQKSRKGIIYQLIQEEVIKNHEVKVDYEEVKTFAMKQLKSQMAIYGQLNFGEEQLNSILDGALKNREEYQRMSEQTFLAKLLELYKEKVNKETKEVDYEAFGSIITEKIKKQKETLAV